MAYAPVDPGKFGPGMPLDTSNMEHLWKGRDKTNGFLMRSVDGRLPALQLPIGRMAIDVANELSDDGLIPWGNALWRNTATMDTLPGMVHAEKPASSELAGVLKFQQGWQAGNPVQNHGLPVYSKGVIIRKGLVGYKTALASIAQAANYLKFLKGDASQDTGTVRTTYREWVAALKTASSGSASPKLALFFENGSGFPVVSVHADPTKQPAVAGLTFGGFAIVFEPEHEAVFFDIN